jgi:predicted HicB family RNase H-like nuclease
MPRRRRPTPARASGAIALRLPKSLHRQAALCAARDGVSVNQWLLMAIAAHVGALHTADAPPVAPEGTAHG